MREAILLRVLAPSARIADSLGTDPQIRQALSIATEEAKYKELLAPPPAGGGASEPVPTRAQLKARIFPPS